MTLLGTAEQLDEAGLGHTRRPAPARSQTLRPAHGRGGLGACVRAVLSVADRPLRVALALGLALLVISTLVLHFGYHWAEHHSHLPILDAIYFTVETVATVGFGDFSFSNQPTWIEAFGIGLIVAGTTLVTTMFALLTNALVSRRLAQSLGHEQHPGYARARCARRAGRGRHAGARRAARSAAARWSWSSARRATRYVAQARSHGVPVVLGDATRSQTLDSVNLASAAAVAILTSDDLTNIETGLAVRDRLGERWTHGAGGAARVRPPARPPPGAELRLPPRVVDLGDRRAVVRGRRRSAWKCCSPSMSATTRSCSRACA